MKQILVLILYFAIIYDVQADRVRRFVGGDAASLAQFPYMVSLRRTETHRHFCGGSIIHKDFILTAAHCVEDKKPSDFYVAAGTNTIYTWRKRYFVAKFSMHSLYDAENITDDIAIIKLKKSITFNQYIQKIPLYKSEVPIGESLTISGWGYPQVFGDNSPRLKYANVTSVSLKICRRKIRKVVQNHFITKNHMCTYDGPGHGFCDGDSGSPLVYQGKQVGIVSWAILCADGYPDIYVKVMAYLKWIENAMKILNKKHRKNDFSSSVLNFLNNMSLSIK